MQLQLCMTYEDALLWQGDIWVTGCSYARMASKKTIEPTTHGIIQCCGTIPVNTTLNRWQHSLVRQGAACIHDKTASTMLELFMKYESSIIATLVFFLNE